MTFGAIKKVGLIALLAGTFAFGGEKEVSTPASKQPVAVKTTSSKYKNMTARQADVKMKKVFAEQEKSLTPKQRAMWRDFKSCKAFKLILPEIKMNMDISKIHEISGKIYVPFETRDDIKDLSLCGSFGNASKSIMTGANNPAGAIVVVHHYNSKECILPSHDVPYFVKQHPDCYFYTPKAALDKLSDKEQEYIQTLDKALNAVYHFAYGYGFAKIDVKKLAKGEMAGWAYNDGSLLGKNRVRTSKAFERWCKGRSDTEIGIHDILGYPIRVEEIPENSRPLEVTGGCSGEIIVAADCAHGGFRIPDSRDISKDKERLHDVYGQIRSRQREFSELRHERLDKKIEKVATAAKEKFPNASEQFNDILTDKVNTVHIYNKLLIKVMNSWRKMPDSLAATGVLDKYLKQNLKQKQSDENTVPTVRNIGKQNVNHALSQKNTQLERES